MSTATEIVEIIESHLGYLVPTNVNIKGFRSSNVEPDLPDNIDRKDAMKRGQRVVVTFYTKHPLTTQKRPK